MSISKRLFDGEIVVVFGHRFNLYGCVDCGKPYPDNPLTAPTTDCPARKR